MSNFILSGFSDEIDENIVKQFEVLNKLGISYFEPRGIDGKNISELNDEEIKELKEKMEKYNIKVSSIGSPIGKIKIEDDFEEHFEKFKRVIKTAKELGTKYVRIFSFYLDEGEEDKYKDRVIEKIKRMVKLAEEEGIILLHENEKGIYGATADRCLEIFEEINSPNLRAIFDPANFVQCGEITYPDAFLKLKPYIEYMHIKDSDNDSNVVAAGEGEGRIDKIIDALNKDGYNGFLSLEPHLGVFAGLQDLELDDKMMSLEKSGEHTFTYAYDALIKILNRSGIMKPIKVGIVGLGRAGFGTHTKIFTNKADKYEIVAVCDTLPDRVEHAVSEFGCKGYSSIEELIKDPEVELVDIATFSGDHSEHAKMALKAGKNVVIEKPVAVTYDAAKDLFDFAAQEGMPKLYPRQNRRNEAPFVKVCEVIDSGILGTVSEVNIEQRGFERRDDWQTLEKFGGGLLLNWGPHIVDHAVILTGSEIKEQYGIMQHSSAGGDREDQLVVHLVGENGRKVNMTISGASAINKGRTFTVYGNRGALQCVDNQMYIKYIEPTQKFEPVVSKETPPAQKWGKSGTFETKTEIQWVEERYEIETADQALMWDWLYDDLRNGIEYPIKTEEVLRMMKVISNLRDNGKVWDLTAKRDEPSK